MCFFTVGRLNCSKEQRRPDVVHFVLLKFNHTVLVVKMKTKTEQHLSDQWQNISWASFSSQVIIPFFLLSLEWQ